MSAEQSKLGRDVDVLIFDDPIGSPEDADNPEIRDAVDKAIAHYTARCQRRGSRGSVLGVMSPWHQDDPMGRRRMRKAVHWEILSHPAIDESGCAFAPSVIDAPELLKIREELREQDPSERLWHAQFMCQPISPVDIRFGTSSRFHTEPMDSGFKFAIGVDLAYTPGEGDWFALVVVKIYGSIAYVLDVVRERADFNVLENIIRNLWGKYGRCPIFSYISGPEKGAVRYFTDRGIPIQGLPARYSKSTRAQKTIDRWNAGKVSIPLHDRWVPGFLSRVSQFTGSDKARDDDEIDALVSVCDGMMGSDAGNMPRAFGKPRM
jgi:predicted phage terminase large subunit-like protein